MIDLTVGTYPDENVPDKDITIALKVLRTIRIVCDRNGISRDFHASALLGRTHAFIVEACDAIGADVKREPHSTLPMTEDEVRYSDARASAAEQTDSDAPFIPNGYPGEGRTGRN